MKPKLITFIQQMPGTHSPLGVPFTLAILAAVMGLGMGFLADSKKLDYPLHLTLEPSKVSKATSENVKLRCTPGVNKTVQIEKFTMIRILKQDSTDSTGKTWITKVEKENIELENAALELFWPVATADTFGVYHCDAIGFAVNSSIVTGNTPNIEIKMNGVTASDLLDVFMKTKARMQNAVSNNSDEIGELKGELDVLTEAERNSSAGIERRLDLSERAIDAVMQRLIFPENPWPSGRYALLQPDTGCPVALNFYGGHTGFYTMHGESSRGTNVTFAKPETHLAQPVITTSGSETFLTLRFCMSNTVTNNIPWPKGDYCIVSATGGCPSGFTTGRILVGTEATNNRDAAGGNRPTSGGPTDLRFCCTKTGTYSTPVVLPTEQPFYLYRNKNPCQQVAGMNVEIDYFEIAVETSSSRNGVSGVYPYTVFKTTSRRFDLCYYSKK